MHWKVPAHPPHCLDPGLLCLRRCLHSQLSSLPTGTFSSTCYCTSDWQRSRRAAACEQEWGVGGGVDSLPARYHSRPFFSSPRTAPLPGRRSPMSNAGAESLPKSSPYVTAFQKHCSPEEAPPRQVGRHPPPSRKTLFCKASNGHCARPYRTRSRCRVWNIQPPISNVPFRAARISLEGDVLVAPCS
ncbi:hypothetical protein P171DRAFT_24754 [Karstenula rhodostoma CBS 690.94]|uniref:Uncharacterized protein n=1 Tax=Karstenula rhodostoma CBS 690.94 TaxID=1392251 RepID=A0A9P4UBE4_9PLEO|nr:hypothetical protein P171DRAFT_24754 [Karstenula rhodostoma CBS 690.94]